MANGNETLFYRIHRQETDIMLHSFESNKYSLCFLASHQPLPGRTSFVTPQESLSKATVSTTPLEENPIHIWKGSLSLGDHYEHHTWNSRSRNWIQTILVKTILIWSPVKIEIFDWTMSWDLPKQLSHMNSYNFAVLFSFIANNVLTTLFSIESQSLKRSPTLFGPCFSFVGSLQRAGLVFGASAQSDAFTPVSATGSDNNAQRLGAFMDGNRVKHVSSECRRFAAPLVTSDSADSFA